MLEKKLTSINGINMKKGVGQAWFNREIKPDERYFLEKRWSEGDKILGAILMNPSHADEVKSDGTVNILLDYAKYNDFDALYLVNIVPVIEPNSKKLKKRSYIQEVQKDEQKQAFIHMLDNSSEVYVGWGNVGENFFHHLFEGNNHKLIADLKSKFLNSKFNSTGVTLKKAPRHPKQGNKRILEKNTSLIDVTKKIKNKVKRI